MFERYSEGARRVMHYSKYFADRVGSPKIETEHLLLGLLRTDQNLAGRFLGSSWAAEEIWEAIQRDKPIGEMAMGQRDIGLSNESKNVLSLVTEEADLLSSDRIRTEHLLLGLLREGECRAAKLLADRGLNLDSTRKALVQNPHNYSATEVFVREESFVPEDVAELRARVKSIRTKMEDAIAKHDFEKARECSNEEAEERKKLFLLCQRYGLSCWIFD